MINKLALVKKEDLSLVENNSLNEKQLQTILRKRLISTLKSVQPKAVESGSM